ncbi:phage tail sheath family protein [Desertifilum sp. FACHB-1129]|uniref:Phage tail protein n=1 Tax=Desertifilum tharense IPPAS B-1220 TaxID=1781255 RepID=A0A1E5QR99_9CYAN|nr:MULTISPECIES: phage tail sheath C-terminal domain-containing protein [Desertifilum]MCD8487736.1 phage tail sheath subtilisin-like domain-containing protein [Desertifilum sp.]MDA0212119.1 phage tail sheath subtilisin-like domain-containing protein [Cyanobacteria bacterium FC1]MDI9638274.1 phage tail sheath subtilisin-like domain-containing protein [Geitlerinema splendidum]MBD2313175.1 phage tail sheath family protein [Desertifilum sp. FACHB-1129]MBD2323562.1 phage tail sheath family protein 
MARLDYFAPGVYVEEIQRGSRPIEGIQTNIAGFIGFTEAVRGGAEPFKPMLVTSWNQYLQYFGQEGSDGFTDFDAYLPFAVNGWFLNGGGRCWVTSIGTRLPGTPEPPPEQTGVKIRSSANRPALLFNLKPEESDNGSIEVIITEGQPNPSNEEGENSDSPAPVAAEFFTLIVGRDGEELERYEHLTMNPEVQAEVGTYVVTALEQSSFIDALDLSQTGQALSRRPANGQYEVSPPPLVPSPETLVRDIQGIRDERTGVQGVFEIDEITMLACPDLMRAYQADLVDLDQVHGVMELMISLCENSSPNPPNRMVVLDPPPDCVKPQQVAQWLNVFNRRSMFAALYYPWIKVPNPRKGGRPILVPPCGHMLGVWSRTDETRGVYKAPANETPRGVIGLSYDCNFREQELLNPLGINCIRTFPNRGIKIWGARTLVEPEQTEWRYISVRRLISYIEKSIELGTQWVVFEPNDEDLWSRVRRTVSNFLERLWREGALFGSSPEQAFYVKCDGDLNTPDSMILGRLYVEVGVCPVRPAEFVIFRVSQWTGQDE